MEGITLTGCDMKSRLLNKIIYKIYFYRRSRSLNFNLMGSGVIGRAKMKTVKIMGILVLGFVLCWTPYYVMSIWWWAHQKTAEKLDFRLQKLLWAFACLNNCINPLLYRMVGPYK